VSKGKLILLAVIAIAIVAFFTFDLGNYLTLEFFPAGVRGILSPGLVISFILLGIFPLIAKWIISAIKARKVLAQWPRPKSFDRNLVVIGAGTLPKQMQRPKRCGKKLGHVKVA
jgi:hypothetical protein